MRDSHTRDVTFYDIIVRSDPAFAPALDIHYFIQKVSNLYAGNQTEKWNKTRSKKIYIREMEVDQNAEYALFLLYYNNGDVSPASYAHLDTNQQRIAPIRTREGRPESAHLLIKLTPQRRGQKRYLVLLEDSTRLNRAVVENYLSFLFDQVRKANLGDFRAPSPDGAVDDNGDPITEKFYNKFELEGHPSTAFLQMIREGKLTGISLETASQDRYSIADGAYVRPIRRDLKLAPTSGSWAENPIERFREALRLGARAGYEQARVTFNSADNKSHTAKVITATGNMIADSLIKKKRLTFNTLLNDADEQIHSEIKAKMLAIF